MKTGLRVYEKGSWMSRVSGFKDPKKVEQYIYCIIDGTASNLGNIGMRGKEVYAFPYKDLSAVISEVPLEPIEPNDENHLIHERVVSLLQRDHTVLPAKSYTVLGSVAAVAPMLSKIYGECKAELKAFENKVELGVKIFYDGKSVQNEQAERQQEIAKLRKDLVKKTKTRTLGEAVKRLMDHIDESVDGDKAAMLVRVFYANRFHDTLRKHAVDARANKLIDDDMILNGSYLVSKVETEQFQKELKKLREEHETRGFEFSLSGPWAPYNFTKIKYY